MSGRTVRDVLEAFVDRTLEAALAADHEIADRGKLLSGCLAELRDVLSTGDQWVTRTLPAEQVAAGDVIVDKQDRLWAVTAVVPDVGWSTLTIRRGDREVDRATKHATTFPTLLTRTDDRALALLERELGAEVVGRGVAPC